MSAPSGNSAPARPRQVTVAGLMAAGGCLLLVVTLFDSMATVRSTEMRDRIEEFLRTPPGNGLGLDVAGTVELLRGVVLVSGALAAAGAVLAVYTLQRHRGARVGLSIAAALMLFSATFVSGILPLFVAVAAAMLWGRDARDWFDGRAPRPGPAPHESPPLSRSGSPPASQSGPAGESIPPEWGAGGREERPPPTSYPYGTRPAPPYATGPAWPSEPYAPVAQRSRRPGAVLAAGWLTWVFSGLTVVFFLLVMVAMLTQRDVLLADLQKNAAFADLGLSTRQILGTMWVLSAVSVFWALSAMVLAGLAIRRVALGRIALLVSAAVAGLVCLVAVPVGWLNAAACFACVVLLSRRDVRGWYAEGRPPGGPPPPPVPGPEQKPPVW